MFKAKKKKIGLFPADRVGKKKVTRAAAFLLFFEENTNKTDILLTVAFPYITSVWTFRSKCRINTMVNCLL